MLDHYDTMKPLTTIVIEKTLLDIGVSVYDKLVDRLYEKYHCYIHDCYEKPEYLMDVLKELYGTSHKVIIYSIENELKEFTHDKKTAHFLQILVPEKLKMDILTPVILTPNFSNQIDIKND